MNREKNKGWPRYFGVIPQGSIAAAYLVYCLVNTAVTKHNHRNEILQGPFLGGVVVVDTEGKEIPWEKLTNRDIKEFLKRSLEEARANTNKIFMSEPVGQNPEIMAFGKNFDASMEEAIRRVNTGDYSKALDSIQSALEAPPSIKVGPTMVEGTVDMKQLTEEVGKIVTPIQNAEKALEWLTVTKGVYKTKGDQGRGLQ